MSLEQKTAASAPRPSVLVVDDDPDLLRLMQIRLSAAGYAVTTAESAERASRTKLSKRCSALGPSPPIFFASF